MAPRTEETIREYPLPEVHADVKDYYRNVIRACRGEEAPLITHDQIRKVMKLMEAVFRSAEKNQVVTEIW